MIVAGSDKRNLFLDFSFLLKTFQDESHFIKNAKAARTKAALELLKVRTKIHCVGQFIVLTHCGIISIMKSFHEVVTYRSGI